jgi:hypothetical protein
MLSRRIVLSSLVSVSALAASGAALAKKKNHQNGHALLGDKVKKNGKHKIHKAGKVDVSADVTNGKVVGLTASDPAKGNLQVRKVRSRQKFAEAAPDIVEGRVQLAQANVVYYYGYWFDDGVDDWYYWFPAEYVIVDDTWVEYVA